MPTPTIAVSSTWLELIKDENIAMMQRRMNFCRHAALSFNFHFSHSETTGPTKLQIVLPYQDSHIVYRI